ncbi:hypothetical protein FIC03_27115, partial [Escherichia coli]
MQSWGKHSPGGIRYDHHYYTTIGIDLAKNVFAIHGVDQNGKTVLVKSRVTRAAFPGVITGLPPCVIGME